MTKMRAGRDDLHPVHTPCFLNERALGRLHIQEQDHEQRS